MTQTRPATFLTNSNSFVVLTNIYIWTTTHSRNAKDGLMCRRRKGHTTGVFIISTSCPVN